MEVGQTVVLVNLNNLYESLYDVLNGYHVKLGDKNYVDLGLGTHRVKCAVHPDFRLIVVAEDTEVHNTFPIPLINRLEKHFLGMETMLEGRHAETVSSLRNWVQAFCHIRRQPHEMGRNFQKYVPEDVFVGKMVLISADLVINQLLL